MISVGGGVSGGRSFPLLLLFVFVSYRVRLCRGDAAEWSYTGPKGPENWSKMPGFETCGESSQSPVNIQDARSADWLTPLVFKNYEDVIKDATIINNGHTVQLSPRDPSEAKLSGGCMKGTYTFLQMHFHWGSNDTRGSEHTLAGRTFPMEAHLVHMSDKYDDLEEALKDPDGLAVLAVMYTITGSKGEATTGLDPVLKFLERNRDPLELPTKLAQKVRLSSFLPDDVSRYYCYRRGSLTTPRCDQAVVWTILDDTVRVTRNQLDYFRKARDLYDKPLVNNFRPLQPLNGRIIYFHSSAPLACGPSLLLLLWAVAGSRAWRP